MLTLADSEAVLDPESLAMPPVTPPVTQPRAATGRREPGCRQPAVPGCARSRLCLRRMEGPSLPSRQPRG